MDATATFFVTKTLWPKKPVLTQELRLVVLSSLRFAVENKKVAVAAFVVMPDHWHALFAPVEGSTLPRFMHSFMSFVGGKTSAHLARQGTAWEEGYYETRIRSTKQFLFVRDYICLNPVRKGLVKTPEKWDAIHVNHVDLVTLPWPWTFEKNE